MKSARVISPSRSPHPVRIRSTSCAMGSTGSERVGLSIPLTGGQPVSRSRRSRPLLQRMGGNTGDWCLAVLQGRFSETLFSFGTGYAGICRWVRAGECRRYGKWLRMRLVRKIKPTSFYTRTRLSIWPKSVAVVGQWNRLGGRSTQRGRAPTATLWKQSTMGP